ncbi:MAG: hypothetical protein J0I84_18475 [Terrimonas sp.]|nr:hypothetical protein [Terrimonas sp.]
MASVLEKEMYSYFIQLNEAEKKSVGQMLKTFVRGKVKRTLVSVLSNTTRNWKRLSDR